MSSLAISTVLEARSLASDWLLSHLPDRFAAGIPEHDENQAAWRIPVWLSYPQLEPLGPVGELILDEATGALRDHTPIDQMKAEAIRIYDQHRERIEAPLL